MRIVKWGLAAIVSYHSPSFRTCREFIQDAFCDKQDDDAANDQLERYS